MSADAPIDDLAEVAAAFGVRGTLRAAAPFGDGHIHRTWLVEMATTGALPTTVTRVVAQSLNAHVFRDLPACERNLRRIDDHFAAPSGRDAGVRVPRLRRTAAGMVHWTDRAGTTWRMSDFAAGTRAGTTAAHAEEADGAARGFGAYMAALAALPGGSLEDTIPHFHDLGRRRAQLDLAVAADRVGRRTRCVAELEAAARIADRVRVGLAAMPPLPVRTVHNDAKVANVLFDAGSARAAVVVDLDTTMDGTVLADVGELLRTASTVWPEDTDDPAGLEVDDDRIEAVVRGFLAGAGGIVTRDEGDAFGLAGPLLATENAVRFLADYLDGDRYFAIAAPDHNLRRARAQLRVAELLLERRDLVTRISRSKLEP